MRTRIIDIGNSRGVRIPKAILEESGLEDEVELRLEPDGIRLCAPAVTRAGWAGAFEAMAAAGDDGLLDGEGLPGTAWDDLEWQW